MNSNNTQPKTTQVIGIDHGWSNIKTNNHIFITGVKEMSTEPAFPHNILKYKDSYYSIGGQRLGVQNTKTEDDNFYLLTLAAIGKELHSRNLKRARVFLGVGLPLTRFGTERDAFVKYLSINKEVSFFYEDINYNITIEKVMTFPQCFAAIAEDLEKNKKNQVVVDIGSWTIDIMAINNGLPDQNSCRTLPHGLITCMRHINDECIKLYNCEIPEEEILEIIKTGKSSLSDKYKTIVIKELKLYVKQIVGILKELGYPVGVKQITFLGGGAIVVKKFGDLANENISYIEDIRANARGYEWLVKASKFYKEKK